MQFVLSPRDTVAITSVFVVEPVPEPAGLALIGIVAAGLLSRRRCLA